MELDRIPHWQSLVSNPPRTQDAMIGCVRCRAIHFHRASMINVGIVDGSFVKFAQVKAKVVVLASSNERKGPAWWLRTPRDLAHFLRRRLDSICTLSEGHY